MHVLGCLFLHPFVLSFIHSSLHSFIHSFTLGPIDFDVAKLLCHATCESCSNQMRLLAAPHPPRIALFYAVDHKSHVSHIFGAQRVNQHRDGTVFPAARTCITIDC